ncbi:hypothetical protein H6G65_03060 [Microcystis elabens FACHB-917]|nr:hypothetical protein [Microcystis elabens FACHB-917]
MIDFAADSGVNFGYHRHGWNWVVVELMKRFHADSAPLMMLSFAEQNLLFQGFNSRYYDILVPHKPWVGIFHLPPHVPAIQSRTHQLRRLLTEPRLMEIMATCVATIALSTHLRNFMHEEILPGSPAFSLLHPAPYEVPRFMPEQFLERLRSSGRLRLVQLGFWLRRHHLIHRLMAIRPAEIEAFQVGINTPRQKQALQLDAAINDVSLSPDVFLTSRLTDHQYDCLLCESVVLLPLYDTSANNSLIECITRCTPVLLERHPAGEEYLGVDYPLFYESFDELCEWLAEASFVDRVLQGHRYLVQLCLSRHLEINRCLQGFQSILSNL